MGEAALGPQSHVPSTVWNPYQQQGMDEAMTPTSMMLMHQLMINSAMSDIGGNLISV